jgi:hypothetical protein
LGTIAGGAQAGEDVQDLATMVDILSGERAKRKPGVSEQQADEFALGVLCFIFDPVKPRDYRDDIRAMRREFGGIATDPTLQDEFRESLSDKLLDADGVRDAVRQGVDHLFKSLQRGTLA